MKNHINKKIFWIASYPKSGNTWMRAILLSLFFTKNGIFNFKLFNQIRYFDTPGNLLKKCIFLNKSKTKIKENSLNYTYFFLDQYLHEKDPLALTFASFFIEKFYTELCFNNVNNSSIHFQNYSKILRQIIYMKNFNLVEKNTLISIKDILHHETR